MFFLGSVLPYLALAIFLLGMVWQTARWLRRPVPFSLAISPTGAGPGRRAATVAGELLLLPGLLRGDRRLWLVAWMMHGSLALIVVGHLLGISCQARQFCYLGASPEMSAAISAVLGTAAGAVFTACLLALAARRVASPEVRRLSDPGDYLVLAAFLAAAVTGLAMRWVAGEAELAAVRGYLGGLLTFRPKPLPDSTLFVVHFTLVNVLLVCFPFSKLAHLTGGIVGRFLLVGEKASRPWPSAGNAPDPAVESRADSGTRATGGMSARVGLAGGGELPAASSCCTDSIAKPPLHLAKEEDVRAIGIEPVAGDARRASLLSRLASLVDSTRALSVMLDNCTRCGNCAGQCHSYLGTGDYHNIPAARADLMRRLYRRHFTLSGRLLGRLAGARDFDAETIGRWVTYFYQCNECRRCAVFCPLGIDTAEITIAARDILSELGVVPKFMQGIAANLRRTGNNMGIPKPALVDSAGFLEGEIREETGREIRIPIDQPGCEILYVPSSADFFTNVDTMIGVAKMFHALGARWTISSAVLEAANFGLLFHLPTMREHQRRLREAAAALGVSLVVQGECGHGWRAARMGMEDVSSPAPFRLVHVLDYAAQHLGRLKLRKLPMRVTLHDPCNYVRAGGIVEQPRQVLRACVQEFVEMTPNRQESFCCGAGSGILMDEMMDIRLKLGRKKAEQVEQLGRLDYLAVPCSICKAQLPHVMKHYGMEGLAMGGVMDLVAKAIQLDAQHGQ